VAEVLAQVVGCAVGVHGELPDDSALAFNASFYRAIAFGRSVRDAFEQGRTAVALEGLDAQERPRLFAAPGVDPARLVLVPEPPRPQLHHAAPEARMVDQDRERDGRQQVVTVTGDGTQVFVAGRDLKIPGGPGAQNGSGLKDGVRRFEVRYTPRELTWQQYRQADAGTLLVGEDELMYHGKRAHVHITSVLRVSRVDTEGLLSSSWVRVDYGNPKRPSVAFFAQVTTPGVDYFPLGTSPELFHVLQTRVKLPFR
jgi:hypothetical protein